MRWVEVEDGLRVDEGLCDKGCIFQVNVEARPP